ncbi:MAG: peptidase [Lapillicoccus sp.]
MLRRAILVIAAAVALVVAPTAAWADYVAPGFTATVSDPSPAIGQPFNVTLSGNEANARITLTITSDPASISSDAIQIAGTKALTRNANASGVASFSVTLSAVGTYTLTMTDFKGTVLSTQTVSVHAVSSAGAVAASGGQLSATGFGGTGIAISGGLLVLAGAGALVVARRRRTADLTS